MIYHSKTFALRAHPSHSDEWAPPVYVVSGDHGFWNDIS